MLNNKGCLLLYKLSNIPYKNSYKTSSSLIKSSSLSSTTSLSSSIVDFPYMLNLAFKFLGPHFLLAPSSTSKHVCTFIHEACITKQGLSLFDYPLVI
ncbi:hypothetical protein VIGAN_09054900 [Vigna angularis var. angularis]|uniref:Uncharacterized protein n=1 Tax=Vigna angularis var. angularis TaxID=157739 RepID=A0A0S3SWC0_PHAAN|nr:hypothetical protein VIGAN_09054900 [Vigna angularis var. angularis]